MSVSKITTDAEGRSLDPLVSCPFCGSEASEWGTEDTEWIMCSGCYACTDVQDAGSGDARRAWNRRTAN